MRSTKTDSCAKSPKEGWTSASAGTAVSRSSVKENRRILFQLPRSLVLFVSLETICPRSTHLAILRSGIEADAPGLDFGDPAVMGPVKNWPVRPVTLRRHLSVTLPFSKSR